MESSFLYMDAFKLDHSPQDRVKWIMQLSMLALGLPNMKKSNIMYFFERPEEIPLKTLDQVRILIEEGSGVGTSWVKENLREAFLIGYALHEGVVIGTSTHKYPKEAYRKKIEEGSSLRLTVIQLHQESNVDLTP